MLTHDEVVQIVHGTLADILGVDADAIDTDASLIEDLDAEFEDFEDIAARLADAFETPIPPDELFPEDVPPEDLTVDALISHIEEQLA